MSEENQTEAKPAEVETPAETSPKKEEPETVVVHQKEQPVIAKSLEDICIEYAKRFNGYPYISASRLVSYDDQAREPKDVSNLARRLRLGYLMSGRGSKEEFIKAFVGQPIVYIQAHREMPTLSKDGCYNNINISGKPFKTFNVSEHVLLKADDFKPFIICKTGPNEFAKIEGDPYYEVTKEEADAVMHMLQDDQSSEKK